MNRLKKGVVLVFLMLILCNKYGFTQEPPEEKRHQMMLSLSGHSFGFGNYGTSGRMSIYNTLSLFYGYKFDAGNEEIDPIFLIPKVSFHTSNYSEVGGGIEFALGKNIVKDNLAFLGYFSIDYAYMREYYYTLHNILSEIGIGFNR